MTNIEGRGPGAVDSWSWKRHGRDLWFLANGQVKVCVRFPNPRLADAADAAGILAADDPAILIRERWLGGASSDRGRIVCAKCSRSLEYWDGSRTLGVHCVKKFAEPSSVGELPEWSAKWVNRRDHTTEIERERTVQQDFVSRPGGGHEQRQAHTGQQAQARSPEQERLEQEQRDWAAYWTPERARQAQARALARQSSEDGTAD